GTLYLFTRYFYLLHTGRSVATYLVFPADPRTVIPNLQLDPLVLGQGKKQAWIGDLFVRMFKRIGDPFVDDKPQGKGRIHVHFGRMDLQFQVETLPVKTKTLDDTFHQVGYVFAHVDQVGVLLTVQAPVNQGHGFDALLSD